MWVIKIDEYTNVIWERTYGTIYNDCGYSVKETNDSGYVIVGYTTSSYTVNSDTVLAPDVWLIRVDRDGNLLWTKTYRGYDSEYGYSVDQTSDGGYIIVGYTSSFETGGCDVWLLKTDTNGDTLWTRTYGGTKNDLGYSVDQTSEGGYIIAGYTESYGPAGYDVLLLKVSGTSIPDISVLDTVIDFYEVETGDTAKDTLLIRNLGNGDLVIDSIILTNQVDFMVLDTGSFVIGQGDSMNIRVLCTPEDTGIKTGELKIYSNDPDEPIVDVILICYAVGVTETRPRTFGLSQNIPNPFTKFTVIKYQLPLSLIHI